jgi:DNA-binding GntR family transcriptional regulator
MSPATCRQRAYDHIRQKLLSGAPPTGERLSEYAFAREIGISRTPVREALTQLATEGLLEHAPGGGVVLRQITREEFAELTDLRRVMECHAVGRAARRITDAQIRELRDLIDRLRRISRGMRDEGPSSWNGELGRQLGLTDMLFHLKIMEAARSPRLLKIVGDFNVLATHYRPLAMQTMTNVARVLLQHWRIYRALASRDAQGARRAMRAHFRGWRKRLLALFDRQQRETRQDPHVGDWSALLEEVSSTPLPRTRGRGRVRGAHAPTKKTAPHPTSPPSTGERSQS